MRIKSERHSKCDQSCGQALGAAVVVILMVCTLCGVMITWKANPPHLEVRYEIAINVILRPCNSHVISACLYYHASFSLCRVIKWKPL